MSASVGPQAVAIARRWIGTPYLHQGASCGVGADCLGLVRGVWRALYGSEPETVPRYSADWSEPAREELLWRAVARHCPQAQGEALGDVILFRVRAGAVAKHLGIVSELGARPALAAADRRAVSISRGSQINGDDFAFGSRGCNRWRVWGNGSGPLGCGDRARRWGDSGPSD